VTAGRSQFIGALPSFYVLLCACQDVVGYLQRDFDTGTHLSHILPYVTSILICLWMGDPKAPLLIDAQVVQKLKEHIEIGAGFYPNDTLGGNINADFLDHEVNYQEDRFEDIDQGFLQAADDRFWPNHICYRDKQSL